MRRIFQLCVVLIGLAFFGVGTAHAQASCSFPTESEAYAAALDAAKRCAAQRGAGWSPRTYKVPHHVCAGQWNGDAAYSLGGYGGCDGINAGYTWSAGGSCSSRADMLNVRYDGGGSMCSGGCVYAPVIGAREGNRVVKVKSSTGGSHEVTKADRMAPTGEACTVSKEMPEVFNGQDQCFQDPKLTQCVKQDGTICAGKNKQFCWSPGEHGIKTSGNEAASLVPEGKSANLPPVAPKNGGEWEKVADALVTIAENKNGNSTTNNSTLNNYESSYGSGGNGASGNGASGEGNGGSGDGTGSGNGDGEGGDGDGAGAPGQGVGDLYTNSGKTVAGVFGEFKARVGNSPLIAATRAFFTVNASGGCPVFTVPASAYWESMTYDAHCSGDFLAALRSIGWVLMAIAALAAAYWALS